MKSTWLILSMVLIQLFPLDLFCQTGVTISKPRLELSNEYLIIEYDIINDNPTDLFKVWIEITNASGFLINAQSLLGDIGEDIAGGMSKRILWNLQKVNIFNNEEISQRKRRTRYVREYKTLAPIIIRK